MNDGKRDNKRTLRSHFRAARQRLSVSAQQNNADNIKHHLLRSGLLLRHQGFAAYLAADGELNTLPIVRTLWQHAKQVALPCLRSNRRTQGTTAARLDMHFAPYHPDTPLITGHYGLREPVAPQQPQRFNAGVLLMPLVAFDDRGIRLGMGGGFYDRFTAHPRNTHLLRVGLAHSVQHASSELPRDPWDQPLDAVITEQGIQTFTPTGRAQVGNLLQAADVD